MLHRLLIATALVATPAVLAAQETVGTISGTLDSVQVSYSVLDGEDHETGWQETDEGIEITLDAYPSDTPPSEEQRLRLTLVVDTANRDPELLDGDAELRQGGTAITAAAEDIDMEIGSAEITGDSLLLMGNMGVTLSEGDGDAGLFDEDVVVLTADMQATVIRAE